MQYPEGTFGFELNRLSQVDDLHLLSDGDAMVVVAPSLQGRVLTSTTRGKAGKSFGWIRWEFIEKGEYQEKMAYLGGESRMWFGPEFGEFSVFFDRDTEQVDANMRAPEDSEKAHFQVIDKNSHSITSQGTLAITNAHDFTFNLQATRKLSLITQGELLELMPEFPKEVSHVAFRAETTIQNTDSIPWSQSQGLLSIWELGCMLTSSDTRAIIPLKEHSNEISSYFSPVESRMTVQNGVLYFKSDADYVSKIGVPPHLSKEFFGSYSPSQKLLSITRYKLVEEDTVYVNSIKGNTQPYQGDIINIFNGGQGDELPTPLPFYEFESSSSALELLPGESKEHWQEIYHFEGEPEQLNQISRQLLGVNLADIPDF